MAKSKRKASEKKVSKQEQKPDPNLIKVDLANAPLITVKMLASINQNLVNLFTYSFTHSVNKYLLPSDNILL